MITIRLTDDECRFATSLGTSRHLESVNANRRDKHGFSSEKDGLAVHILGVAGELAVAKWKGRYFHPTINTFKGADIGSRVQVRTRSEHWHELIVRKDDADDHAFILVTGSVPVFVIRGWVWGSEAKQPQWLKEHGSREASYFVPQDCLRVLKQEAA